jgi:hypothetical protein
MLRSRMLPSTRGIVVVAALMLSGGAGFAADADSANTVMPGCREFINDKSTAKPFEQGRCTGLINGLAYLYDESCRPSAVTRGQIVRVVVQYIDARPARMHEDFRVLAMEAIKTAWPCQR